MKQKELSMAKADKKKKQQQVDSELQNIIEAALFAAREPIGIRKMMAMFPDDAKPSKVDIQNVLLNLEESCEYRGIELRRIGKGWRFQTKEKYATWLRKLDAEKPPRYSRALLETLSIIAYRQPVTRGDIEDIRGVGVSSDTVRTLEEREWIEQVGHRDVPGRPALFATTQSFLEYFNMSSLRELPELMDKRALGEIAQEMNLTLPMDGVKGDAELDQEDQQKKEQKDAESEKIEEGKAESAEVIDLHPQSEGDDVELSEDQAETDSPSDHE